MPEEVEKDDVEEVEDNDEFDIICLGCSYELICNAREDSEPGILIEQFEHCSEEGKQDFISDEEWVLIIASEQ